MSLEVLIRNLQDSFDTTYQKAAAKADRLHSLAKPAYTSLSSWVDTNTQDLASRLSPIINEISNNLSSGAHNLSDALPKKTDLATYVSAWAQQTRQGSKTLIKRARKAARSAASAVSAASTGYRIFIDKADQKFYIWEMRQNAKIYDIAQNVSQSCRTFIDKAGDRLCISQTHQKENIIHYAKALSKKAADAASLSQRLYRWSGSIIKDNKQALLKKAGHGITQSSQRFSQAYASLADSFQAKGWLASRKAKKDDAFGPTRSQDHNDESVLPYIISADDTIYSVSASFGIDVGILRRYNPWLDTLGLYEKLSSASSRRKIDIPTSGIIKKAPASRFQNLAELVKGYGVSDVSLAARLSGIPLKHIFTSFTEYASLGLSKKIIFAAPHDYDEEAATARSSHSYHADAMPQSFPSSSTQTAHDPKADNSYDPGSHLRQKKYPSKDKPDTPIPESTTHSPYFEQPIHEAEISAHNAIVPFVPKKSYSRQNQASADEDAGSKKDTTWDFSSADDRMRYVTEMLLGSRPFSDTLRQIRQEEDSNRSNPWDRERCIEERIFKAGIDSANIIYSAMKFSDARPAYEAAMVSQAVMSEYYRAKSNFLAPEFWQNKVFGTERKAA